MSETAAKVCKGGKMSPRPMGRPATSLVAVAAVPPFVNRVVRLQYRT